MMQSQLNDLMVYKDSILSNLEESQAAENKLSVIFWFTHFCDFCDSVINLEQYKIVSRYS